MTTRSWMLATLIGGLAFTATPAAANTIWVHKTDPTCGGHGTSGVTCFMTIQGGVNNATTPAQVFVFPGVYPENVDVSTMAMPGDLTLTSVNASGVPAPGTVSVTPATGPAFRTSVSPFPGNFSLNGFTILSTDSNGLNFGTVSGTVAFSHVTADGNKQTGLSFGASSDVTIDSCTANNNGSSGVSFGGGTTVMLTNSSANGNKSLGFGFGATGAVTIESCTANNNESSGFSFGGGTTVMLTNSNANGNKSLGVGFGATGAVTIESCTANNNESSGFSFGGGTTVMLTNSNANGNKSLGFGFGATGAVTIESCTADNNGSSGFSFGGGTTVTLRHSSANGNMSLGFGFDASGDVIIDFTTANHNTASGFSFGGAAVTVRNSQANANNTNGITFDASAAELTCNDIAGNTVAGLAFGSTITAMAEHNWWGAVSGPTIASNPGGTGDKITTGSGTVDFTPFLTTFFQDSTFCGHRPAPAMSEVGLTVAGLLLLGAGAWLARRSRGGRRLDRAAVR